MNAVPRQADNIEIFKCTDGYVIYQPEKDRVHFLNHTAVLVLEMCNGQYQPEEMAQTLKSAYRLEKLPFAEVHEILKKFFEEGLIAINEKAMNPINACSWREILEVS